MTSTTIDVETPKPDQKLTRNAIEPMNVGNTWHYKVTDPGGSVRAIYRTITKKTIIKGNVTIYRYTVTDSNSGDVVGGYDQYVRNGDVFISYDHLDYDEKIIPRLPIFGEAWVYEFSGGRSLYTVVSLDEVVDTSAGSFRCIKIDNETSLIPYETEKMELYFSKDVGLVRTVYSDGSEDILLDFDLTN